MKITLWLALLLPFASSCVAEQQPAYGSNPPLILSDIPLEGPESFSLFGEPLQRPDLPEDVLEARTDQFVETLEFYYANPDSEAALVWLGRRMAYLGRYREAIGIFTRGIGIYPDSYRLLRHRGHRYITIRLFPLALRDLHRASFLAASVPDHIEPDGQPNAMNVPRSTSHSNIWYHRGLAHYLEHDFDQAERSFRHALRYSTNDDMLCATSHWLYMALRRAGREDAAQKVLEPIHADMEIFENFEYHRLLLMYRGEISAAVIEEEVEAASISAATLGYGLANWFLYNGEPDRAYALCEKLIEETPWAAFGHIAAEVDLHRKSKEAGAARRDSGL